MNAAAIADRLPAVDSAMPVLETGLLPAMGPLVVAVSGGCDSMALWGLLAAHGRDDLVIWHLDHGIRSESRRDAELVRASPLPGERRIERADIPALAAQWRCGLEEAGRRHRYARLSEVARAERATVVLTAHHRDDQAETILLNLLRGSHGLAGIPQRRPLAPGIEVVRPLLAVAKSALRSWAEAQGIRWCEDATNRDTAFSRNRVRHAVLPVFEDGCPGFTAALAAAARTGESPLRNWLRDRGLPVSRAIIARLEALPTGGRTTLGRRFVIRTADGWRDEPERAPDIAPAVAVAGPGIWHRDGRTLELIATEGAPDALTIAPEAVRGALVWRSPLPGERWRPLGCTGTQTLHATAARRRVPSRLRPALDVLADDEGPLWMAPGVVAERARVRGAGWRIRTAGSAPGTPPAARPAGA